MKNREEVGLLGISELILSNMEQIQTVDKVKNDKFYLHIYIVILKNVHRQCVQE